MTEAEFVAQHINPSGLVLPDWECKYCGDKNEAASVLDHIVPRSKGGTNDKENLQRICRHCNHAKGSMSAQEFDRWIAQLVAFQTKG